MHHPLEASYVSIVGAIDPTPKTTPIRISPFWDKNSTLLFIKVVGFNFG
jgi:hypothetical protein